VVALRERIAIVDGLRTPFAKSGGALKHIQADDLGAAVARELLVRLGIEPAMIDEVIFGNVAQPPHAANIGRVIALKAGLPENTIAHTVHRNCASGMQSITEAVTQIRSGQAQLVLAGGTESMSQIPLLMNAKLTEFFVKLMRAKTVGKRVKTLASFRLGHLKPIIALQLGLTDPICELNMGQTAEVLAREFSISRAEQDAFALQSHQRALAAKAAHRFDDEITPVIPPPRYDQAFTADDGPRDGQTLDKLAALRPYFDRDAGTVTVGNACPVTDGAVAMLVASERTCKTLGIKPLGYITGWSYAALDGSRMGLGPAFATSKLLDSTGMTMNDFDVIELNEAFAAQVLANQRAFESRRFAEQALNRRDAIGAIDPDKLNVCGGAIALGHPVGATGSRLILTALKELKRRGGGRGLTTLCVGGGQGAAVALEAA